MFRTALCFSKEAGSDEIRLRTVTGKMSQRYSYLSKTTVIEDESNEGRIYDYINTEDLDDRIMMPDNRNMLKFLNHKSFNIDICVRLEKDQQNNYLIRSMLAVPKACGLPDTPSLYEPVFDNDSNRAWTVSRAIDMLYNLKSRTASIEKTLGKLKINKDHEVYEIAKDVFGNLMTEKIDCIPMITDLSEESIIDNIAKASDDDLQMFRGCANLLYGIYANAYRTTKEQLTELDADDWLFFDTYIRKNPLAYKKINNNLDKLIDIELSKVDDDM